MRLRMIKRRHDARTVYIAKLWAPDRFDVRYGDRDAEDNYFHDDDDEPRNLTYEYCSGTGGNPWDDYITQCPRCDGEGYKYWEA